MSIARNPCRRKVRSVREDAEVRDEPDPFASNRKRQSERNDNAENRAAPKRHQWFRIGIKDAVRQMLRNQISRLECPAAAPPTNDVSYLVRQRHDHP